MAEVFLTTVVVLPPLPFIFISNFNYNIPRKTILNRFAERQRSPYPCPVLFKKNSVRGSFFMAEVFLTTVVVLPPLPFIFISNFNYNIPRKTILNRFAERQRSPYPCPPLLSALVEQYLIALLSYNRLFSYILHIKNNA